VLSIPDKIKQPDCHVYAIDDVKTLKSYPFVARAPLDFFNDRFLFSSTEFIVILYKRYIQLQLYHELLKLHIIIIIIIFFFFFSIAQY